MENNLKILEAMLALSECLNYSESYKENLKYEISIMINSEKKRTKNG